MNNSIKISKGDFCIGLYIFTICFNLIMQTLAGTNIQNILFIPKEVLYSLTPKISLLLFLLFFFINGTVSKKNNVCITCFGNSNNNSNKYN